MKNLFLIIAAVFSAVPVLLSGATEIVLSDSGAAAVNRGELVIQTKKIKGAPWPEITVFSKVKASAEVSMGVFYAYHEHREFLPDLLYSIPSRYISPVDLHIRFEMKIPWPLRNSRYTTGNILSVDGKGGFRIDWYHVASTSSKTTRGTIIFKPLAGDTLFVYRTFVHPKSKLAGIFERRMVKEVRRSVRAIISRIESVLRDHPDKIPSYVDALKRSLDGEYIYKNIPGASHRSPYN